MAKVPFATLSPNLGLYLGRPRLSVPDGAVYDGRNFRIKNGKIGNFNLGWGPFEDLQLDGPVRLIDTFTLRTGSQRLIFGDYQNLYLFNDGPGTLSYLNIRYETGTIAVTNGNANIVGTGTNWDPELKAGDKIAFGATGIVDPEYSTNGGWYTIQSRSSDTAITLTAPYTGATNAAITYTARKTFTGDADDLWDTDTFYNDPSGDDLWVATNGKDDIVSWDGAGTQVTDRSAVGFKAKALVTYKNMMLYINVTDNASGDNFPTSIINSDVGDPFDVTTGLSEQFQVHDGEDNLLSGVVLGDAVALYSKRHVTLAQFVGDPLVFLFRSVISDVGPIAAKAVADFGDHHQFLGPDTGYRFDGVQAVQINTHVWREVLRSRAPDRQTLAFHHFDEENGDLIWAVPLTTDPSGTVACDQAFPEHYLESVGRNPTPFSRRDFPFTASGYYQRGTSLTWADMDQAWEDTNFAWNDQFFQAAFPFTLVGDKDGYIYTLGTHQMGDGAALPSYIITGRRPLGDGRMRGLVARVYPYATRVSNKTLNVYLELADHAAGPPTSVGPYVFDLDLNEGEHFVTPYRRARFGAIVFDQPDGSGWELEGWEAELRPGGYR